MHADGDIVSCRDLMAAGRDAIESRMRPESPAAIMWDGAECCRCNIVSVVMTQSAILQNMPSARGCRCIGGNLQNDKVLHNERRDRRYRLLHQGSQAHVIARSEDGSLYPGVSGLYLLHGRKRVGLQCPCRVSRHTGGARGR